MSDRPIAKSAQAETPKPSSAREESPSRRAVPAPPESGASRWPTYAALAIALVAAVLAALAYFHPAPNKALAPQQSGDAKANLCSAYKAAHKSVVINTHMRSQNQNDAIAELSVATNARLALIGGGAYLKDRLAANTAAPADLSDAVNSFANTIEQLGVNYMQGADAAAQDPLRKDLDTQITQLDKSCA
jgi:hypothetical protein